METKKGLEELSKRKKYLVVGDGQFTYDREGDDKPKSPYFSRRIHHPSMGSGITIGRGYDLSRHELDETKKDLLEAGMPPEQVDKYVWYDKNENDYAGLGDLEGKDATDYVKNNRDRLEEISGEVQKRLFEIDYQRKKNKAIKRYGEERAKNPKLEEWDKLDEAVKIIALDIRFQRGHWNPKQLEMIGMNDLEKLAKHISGDPTIEDYENGRGRANFLRCCKNKSNKK
ncbi:MAG: hypothetical protein HQL66_06490 [Magnetococcales bacterium]|nr:hypothetical protein [Magnetococcales bacterium]